MAATGRNAPCPCGSGRKYKKCCLEAEARISTPADDAAAPASGTGRVPASPNDAAAAPDGALGRSFCEELLAAPLAGRLELVERTIAGQENLDGEDIFFLADAIADPLRRAGRTEDLDDLLSRMDDLHPEACAEQRHWISFWRAEDAVLAEGDPCPHLARMLEDPDRSIDQCFWLSDRMRYRGRTERLADVMLEALTRVERSTQLFEESKHVFRQMIFVLLLDDHLVTHPGLHHDDPAFLARTAPVRGMDHGWLERIILHASGRASHRWRPDDFDTSDREEILDHLTLLTLEFGRALRAAWSWPRSRAELGREMICRYLGEKRPSRARSGGYIVLPDADSADRFAASHLHLLGAQPFRVAAFAQALPRWSEFLAERDLMRHEDVRRLNGELWPRFADLPRALDQFVYDPVLAADVSRQWESLA